MPRLLIASLFITLTFSFCSSPQSNITTKQILIDSIIKVEMSLSAFGVESDDYPSIEAYIDFVHDSSICIKSYYNTANKGSIYHLSSNEIKKALELLQNSNLQKLNNEYKVEQTDQPTSTTTIFTNKQSSLLKIMV